MWTRDGGGTNSSVYRHSAIRAPISAPRDRVRVGYETLLAALLLLANALPHL